MEISKKLISKSLLLIGVLCFLIGAGPQNVLAVVPTFIASGGQASGTGAITPALPAGIATNDILLLFIETANQSISISNSNGGTWTQVTNSPQGTGTAGASGATRLTVFWSRYNGTQGAPTTSDSGDHQIGNIIAIRGAVISGDPWDITSGGIEATSDTSGAIPGATTTVVDTLVVAAIAIDGPDNNGANNFSAWANASLSGVTERFDVTRNSGNGGALGIATGSKATIGAYGNTTVTISTSVVKGMMSIAIKPLVSTTTISNGTNPSNSSIAPGASITDLDSFTLQTSTGTDTVTAATVTLAAGSSGGLSSVAITSDSGATTYCSVSNPASDTVSLTSCAIPVTTSSVQFKVRITPKSHANMPSPPGSVYSVTGTVTSFTSTNSHAGTDSSSATVTIDNASPANVTGSTVSAGNAQASLSWTNPVDADFSGVVVLRRASSSVVDVPDEGSTYTVGNTIGTATVACIISSPTASCTDTGLTNGTAYHYKIFSKDSNGNYSTGTVPTGSPVSPATVSPTTTSISPDNKIEGDSGFILTVNGTNFIAGSVVRFNGSDRSTNFVSLVQLTASILTSDLSAAGTFNITVFNPGGGGESNAQTFTVYAPTPTPTPTPTPEPSITPTPIESPTPTPTPAESPTPTPTPEESPQPSPFEPKIPVKRTLTFSGQAYPGSKVEIMLKENIESLFRTAPAKEYYMSDYGSFQVTYFGETSDSITGGNYFFGLRAEDKDNRKTIVVPIDLKSLENQIIKDIFMPPTIGFLREQVRKGDFLAVVGYAEPSSYIDIEVDDKPASEEIRVDETGYYKLLVDTSKLSFGSHDVQARQKSSTGRVSDFSLKRNFTVSELFFPETDFNNDAKINISDLSIFLSRWKSQNKDEKGQIDLNKDGKVDISDFSTFLKTIKK